MLHKILRASSRPIKGLARAVRARPKVFALVALAVLVLNLFLPPVVLSLARKPWDYAAVNPWLKQLPDYLASGEIPLQQKLEFLPRLALFWFSANDRHGFVEWGFSVDVTDLLRFIALSFLFGAYFALWSYGRDRPGACALGARAGRPGGAAGALVSLLGFTTGPCSVVGCGAPVLPVIGLVLTGLTSGTLAFLAALSRVATAAIFIALIAAVATLAWRAGADRKGDVAL
jgi:hypothetical protein